MGDLPKNREGSTPDKINELWAWYETFLKRKQNILLNNARIEHLSMSYTHFFWWGNERRRIHYN